MRFDHYSQAGTLVTGEAKRNQDFALCGNFLCEDQSQGSFLLVADGIGSKAHSHRGGKALSVALKEMLAYEEHLLHEGNLPLFLQSLHGRWLEKLRGYSGDACSCTVLMALVFTEEVHLFRLGDGFLGGVWRDETHILKEDKDSQGKFINETDAMKQDFIYGLWEVRSFSRKGLRGILACTDGIEIGEDSFLDYEDFSQCFLKNLFPLDSFQEELQQLVASQQNRDDKTIACLLEDFDLWKKQLFADKVVYDQYHKAHVCTQLLSQGGQGVVYRTQDSAIAVKILFDALGEQDWKNLEKNQEFLDIRLLPTPTQVTVPSVVLADYVGYTMELLEDMASFQDSFSLHDHIYQGGDWFLDQHKEQTRLVDMLYLYKKTGGLGRRLLAYYKLSRIFLELHSRGLVFGDFSPKNVFLSTSPHYAHVWLIDVDNLDYESNHKKKRGYYTPGFVAPEVAKKEKGSSSYSDNFSFGLALFLQLTGSHPFSMDDSEEEETLLTMEDFTDNLSLQQRDQGLFPWILSRKNHWSSNDSEESENSEESEESEESEKLEEPANTAIPHEFILSPRLYDLFARTFSQTGKDKPFSRPSSLEWQEALGRDVDTAIHCPKCNMDYHYFNHPSACPWCDHKVPLLKVDSYLEEDSSSAPPLWTFVQERRDLLSLPLRLLPQPQTEEDGVLGYVQEQGGELLLTQMHPLFHYEVQDAQGRWGKNHRNFALKDTTFQLFCRGKHQNYRLEVCYL